VKAVVAAWLVITLTAAPVPKHLMPKESVCFPTTRGTTWVYRGTCGEEEILVVTQVEIEKTFTRVVLGHQVGAEVLREEILAVSEHGIERLNNGLYGSDFSGCVLSLPHQEGEKWENRLEEWKEMRKTGPMEKVKVPAGTFEAVRVDVVQYVSNDSIIQFSEWYAPGVGLVKSAWSSGKSIRELKEIRRPTK
jgi:DUF3108-like